MLFTDVRTRSLTQRRLKVDKTDVDNGPSGQRKSDCLLRLQHLPTYPRLFRPIPDVGPMYVCLLGIVHSAVVLFSVKMYTKYVFETTLLWFCLNSF